MLGMVVCLLLLGAGVTAATSAFLARQRLQNACDGAAAVAADAAEAGYYTVGPTQGGSTAADAAQQYLDVRNPDVSASAHVSSGSVVLTCSGTSDIALGALFGVGQLSQSVQAVGRAVM